MLNEILDPIIAIDGGGTYCRIALAGTGSTTCVQAGSANVCNDFNQAINEVNAAINKLSQLTDIPLEKLADLPVYAGLAGVTGRKMAEKVTNALPFTQIRIRDDRASALRGALSDKDGFVAHCGTGSFMGRQHNQLQKLVGGWGPTLGDHASAQWVGRNALARTLETVDELREESRLSKYFLERFKSTAAIVDFAANARPTDFGALAPEVTAYAEQGDPFAVELLNDGANIIQKILIGLGWVEGAPICLTGGIAPFFSRLLPENMQQNIQQPIGSPLDGAIALARAYSQEISDARS